MQENIQFDTYLTTVHPHLNNTSGSTRTASTPPQSAGTLHGQLRGNEETPLSLSFPVFLTALSSLSTLGLMYIIPEDGSAENRSTPLPSYGILGDKVNEVIELFLDALAVYVHK